MESLEDKELYPSSNTENTLLRLGMLLYDALMNADRIDEVEVIQELVISYAVATECYGDKTGRVPESLAVDLLEAVQFRIDSLSKQVPDSEWRQWAKKFNDNVHATFIED